MRFVPRTVFRLRNPDTNTLPIFGVCHNPVFMVVIPHKRLPKIFFNNQKRATRANQTRQNYSNPMNFNQTNDTGDQERRRSQSDENAEQEGRCGLGTHTDTESLNFLANVKVHTPLPASARDETGVKP